MGLDRFSMYYIRKYNRRGNTIIINMVNLTYPEIKEICKSGKIGLIPGWKGYIKYDYYKD